MKDGAKENRAMSSTAAQQSTTRWLAENGPKELELLFRAIVFHPSAPILLADNDRQYREASVGASKLLGLPREKIIGRSLDDFAEPSFKPVISERWRAFSRKASRKERFSWWARTGVRGRSSTSPKGTCCRYAISWCCATRAGSDLPRASVPAWVQDYALFLLDCGREDCRLVCGSGTHLRLQER